MQLAACRDDSSLGLQLFLGEFALTSVRAGRRQRSDDALAITRSALISRACGTVSGSLFIVKVTSATLPPFTSASPGYLFADASVIYATNLPYLKITRNLGSVSIYTLDENNGCALTDITNGNLVVRANRAASRNGGTITIEGNDADVQLSGVSFSEYQCERSPPDDWTVHCKSSQ